MAEYIDKNATVGILEAMSRSADCECIKKRLEKEAKRVSAIPAADVAPVVHGQWIEDHDYLKCPECGVMVKWDFTFFDIGNWNYCPNCGAKMDGSDNNEAD